MLRTQAVLNICAILGFLSSLIAVRKEQEYDSEDLGVGDCGWVTTCGPGGCADCKNDDSPGYRECCGHGSAPAPSAPAAAPAGPSSPAAPGAHYCPSKDDLVVTYGSPELRDQGWKVSGNGGVGTKSSYNLLGGSVEYDIDLSHVQLGINANIYTISPNFSSSGYTHGNYCDGAKENAAEWCLEVDWIETNGNCGGATTLHTIMGPGSQPCTSWGCRANYRYNDKTSFHMKITYGADGAWTTYRDDHVIDGNALDPKPDAAALEVIRRSYTEQGAVIISTEWEGWVPMEDCGGGGSLDGSSFTVSNLRINGSIVNGPPARICA